LEGNPITGNVIKAEGLWEEAIAQIKVANIAQIGDWSLKIILSTSDWHFNISENDLNVRGKCMNATHTLLANATRPEDDIPYMNQKGLADVKRNRKMPHYVLKVTGS